MSQWKIYKEVDLYFCTSTIVDWYPIFTNQETFDIIVQSLAYCQNNKGLQIHGYVIMLNHIHLLLSAKNQASISSIMRDFKRYTSVKLRENITYSNNDATDLFRSAANDTKSQDYKVWQEGFYPIAIESERFFKQKLNYIHDNPVRKGYIPDPIHWLYSSARNYANLTPTPLEVNCLQI